MHEYEAIMVIKNTEIRRVRIPQEFKERRDKLVAANKCLGCEIDLTGEDRASRGLCSTCYQATRHAVRKGKITDEELLRRGEILPPQPGGPKPSNEFTQRLSDL